MEIYTGHSLMTLPTMGNSWTGVAVSTGDQTRSASRGNPISFGVGLRGRVADEAEAQSDAGPAVPNTPPRRPASQHIIPFSEGRDTILQWEFLYAPLPIAQHFKPNHQASFQTSRRVETSFLDLPTP